MSILHRLQDKAVLYIVCFGMVICAFGVADTFRESFAIARQASALSNYSTDGTLTAAAITKLIDDEAVRATTAAELVSRQQLSEQMRRIALDRLAEAQQMTIKFAALLATAGLALGITALWLARKRVSP